MKANKSPGSDGLTSEVYKEMPKEGYEEILKFINEFWRKEEVLEDFKESIIIPIHKKGSKTDPENYREVSLLNTIGKIYTKIIKKKTQSNTK